MGLVLYTLASAVIVVAAIDGLAHTFSVSPLLGSAGIGIIVMALLHLWYDALTLAD